jgi:hypothetical protein
MRVVENAKKQWVANRDFDLKNLQVKKGEILPKSWATAHSRKYLQNNFGEDCIVWTDRMIKDDDKETAQLEDRVKFLEKEVIRLSELIPKDNLPGIKSKSKRNRVIR